MALADALIVLAHDWGNVRERVDSDALNLARRHLAAAVHGAAWEPDALLSALLAHESPGHPAWLALRESPVRRTSQVSHSVAAAAAQLRLVVERDADLVRTGESGSLDPDVVEADAEQRIWAAPAVPVEELTRRPHNLLVVEGEHGMYAPMFQLDEQLELLPAAGEVNAILGTQDDPWGVASWWLTPHAALGAIPADELRTGAEDRVLAAATAAGAVG